MTPEQTVDALIAAVEHRDIDGVLALMSPDAEYDNVPMSKAVGHEQIRGVLAMFLGGDGPPVRFEVVRQAATGNVVMNERIDRFEIGGTAVEIAVAGVFEVDAATETITLWRDYFDLTSFQSQLAAPGTDS